MEKYEICALKHFWFERITGNLRSYYSEQYPFKDGLASRCVQLECFVIKPLTIELLNRNFKPMGEVLWALDLYIQVDRTI